MVSDAALSRFLDDGGLYVLLAHMLQIFYYCD